MKKLIIFSLLVLGFIGLSACRTSSADSGGRKGGGPGGGAGGPVGPPKAVKLEPATERELIRTVSASGTLAADEQAALSFKVPGRLATLSIDLGSFVRKGQAIAQVEPQDYKARVAQAEAALQQARARLGLDPTGPRANLDSINIEETATVRQARAVLEEARTTRERTSQLVRDGVLSRAELDRVESAFKVAESRYQDAIEEVRNRQAVLAQRRSELEIAKQQLADTILYAPFDGAVQQRSATVGEYLSAGAPIATLVRLHPLRLRVEIPEREAFGIRTGLSVNVSLEGDAQKYNGRVARLSPAFQEQSRTLVIEAEVDNQHGKLRPGSFAKAELQTNSSNRVITVPVSSIVTFAGIQKVFLIKDGKAVERNVIVGQRTDEWAVITEGLEANEMVVVSPAGIVAGQPLLPEK
ncbi:MAG TPA: efflux RND transporter periplasmic adaptor subunit [Blastocatellia bacterium]|nr:efflux RND transporter periplasmic adaptor subunit [Blastocatellia bacterium]